MSQITGYDLRSARKLYKLYKRGAEIPPPEVSMRIPSEVVDEMARYFALLQFLGQIDMRKEVKT